MLLISNCSLAPPNVEVCVRLNYGAQCGYTMDGPDRRLSERQFIDQETGVIFMQPNAWGEIKSFIEKICQRDEACDPKKAKKKMDRIDKTLGVRNERR